MINNKLLRLCLIIFSVLIFFSITCKEDKNPDTENNNDTDSENIETDEENIQTGEENTETYEITTINYFLPAETEISFLWNTAHFTENERFQNYLNYDSDNDQSTFNLFQDLGIDVESSSEIIRGGLWNLFNPDSNQEVKFIFYITGVDRSIQWDDVYQENDVLSEIEKQELYGVEIYSYKYNYNEMNTIVHSEAVIICSSSVLDDVLAFMTMEANPLSENIEYYSKINEAGEEFQSAWIGIRITENIADAIRSYTANKNFIRLIGENIADMTYMILGINVLDQFDLISELYFSNAGSARQVESIMNMLFQAAFGWSLSEPAAPELSLLFMGGLNMERTESTLSFNINLDYDKLETILTEVLAKFSTISENSDVEEGLLEDSAVTEDEL